MEEGSKKGNELDVCHQEHSPSSPSGTVLSGQSMTVPPSPCHPERSEGSQVLKDEILRAKALRMTRSLFIAITHRNYTEYGGIDEDRIFYK